MGGVDILLRMTSRPQLSVFIATSLDGYIARRDGGIDWLQSVERPGEDYGYQAFADSVDTMVLGRKTYETALGFPAWPYGAFRCIVLSHQTWPVRNGESFFCGEPARVVEALSRAGARRVYVDGGEVIRQFLAAELIDDLTISVIPILLGDGIPLFKSGGTEQRLALIEGKTFPSGLVQLRYRAAKQG